MATSSFAPALSTVLKLEGGFVRNPLDPGGATKFGITRSTLGQARGAPVSVADVRSLTETEAGAIYRRFYWDTIQADSLPAGPDLALFDFAVNSGPARAVRMLQTLLRVHADGLVGSETITAAQRTDAAFLIHALTQARLGFLFRLRTWAAFGRGWRARVLQVEQAALALIPAPKTQGDIA